MKRNKSKEMIVILVYVLFSVSGLLLLKIGTMKKFSVSLSEGVFDVQLSGILLIGLFLYLMALVTSLIAMKTIDLSIFYPISAGLGYVLVCFCSFFILKENITRQQFIGMAFILVGVVMMNLKQS